MINAGFEGGAVGVIFDSETAAQAHRAGVGATIPVRLGGKTDDLHGTPAQHVGRANHDRVADPLGDLDRLLLRRRRAIVETTRGCWIAAENQNQKIVLAAALVLEPEDAAAAQDGVRARDGGCLRQHGR